MRKVIMAVFTASAVVFSGIASAQGGVGAMELEAFLNQMYKNAIAWITNQDYSNITQNKKTVATNTAKANIPTVETASTSLGLFGSTTHTVTTDHYYSPTEAATVTAHKHTTDNVTDTLTQLPFAMNNLTSSAATAVLNNIKAADGSPFGPNSSGVGGYFANRSLQALTVGEAAAGSDTLYVGDTGSQGTTTYSDNLSFLKQPANLTNDAFNFANIIDHTGYTPIQLSGAHRFVEYAAQSTQNITEGFNFNLLFAKPAALLTLKQSPAYQNFIMRLRSLIALRSINVNTLNQLIAERTKILGLGTAAGVEKITYNSSKEIKTPVANASPLEVEAYQANHRIESKNWYAKIEAASPATVQRDTLVVLAEIEHQNYEAHLDRERLLAAISAISLQSGMTSMSSFLLQARSSVNSAITSAVNPSTSPSANTSSTPPAAPTATAGTSTTSTNSTTSTTSTSDGG